MHSLLWSSPANTLRPLRHLVSYPKLHSDMNKSWHLYNFIDTQRHKFTSLRPRQQRLTSRFKLDSCHKMMEVSALSIHSEGEARLWHVEVSQTKLGWSAESDEVRVPQASAVKWANICSWFQVGNIICSLSKAQGVAAFLLPTLNDTSDCSLGTA